MARLRDTIDRTPEYVNFINELKQFHAAKGTTLQAEPVLGKRRLDLYKIFQVVVNSGGFEEVTKNRGWKQVGDIFEFPSTCTNSAYILKGVYIRNLLGWEEEKLWRKDWVPPKELLGPNAHKSSTLAGKVFRAGTKKSPKTKARTIKPPKSAKVKSSTSATIGSITSPAQGSPNTATTTPQDASAAAAAAATAAAAALLNPLAASLHQFSNPLLFDFSNLGTSTPLQNQHATTITPITTPPASTLLTPLSTPLALPTSTSVDTPTMTAVDTPILVEHLQQQQQLEQQQQQPEQQQPVQPDNVFSEKDRILFALQFGQRTDVEWALDQIVTISFECPEKLELNGSPFLLQLLVSLAQPCLASHAADNALPTSASETLNDMLGNSNNNADNVDTATWTTNDPILADIGLSPTNSTDLQELNIILKVLHILRNFSFLSTYIPTLAASSLVKELLVQGLETSMVTGHVELGRHSIDVLENIAGQMKLNGPDDPCIQCVYKVVAAHDRYLVIGSIRTLTWLTINKENHPYIEYSPVMARITQMLLSDDEEMVGTSLEYIYQHTRVSLACRTQFLTSPYASAYLGLLISLLMTKSKYFCTRFIQEDTALPTPLPSKAIDTASSSPKQETPIVPRVPDLTVYQKLDEPFRCLGWLKDKFEVADRSSILSLDDIYLLYEARFGLEKALKMRDFYTVMKIAFPKASTTETSPLLGKVGQSAPVVEGLNVIGIQIKMNILQDRPQIHCKWNKCSLFFDDTFSLQRHVLHDHMTTNSDSSFVCSWSHCCTEQSVFESKDAWISHLRTHFYNQIGESCCNSPVQSPEPSLSSSPSSPTSNISSSSISTASPTIRTMSIVDDSDVQGIALVTSHLLNWLSKDPQSKLYFIPYEKELVAVAEQRPKLAPHIWTICSNFKADKLL